MEKEKLITIQAPENSLVLTPNNTVEENINMFINWLNGQSRIADLEKAFNAGQRYGVYLQGGSYDKNDDVDFEDYLAINTENNKSILKEAIELWALNEKSTKLR